MYEIPEDLKNLYRHWESHTTPEFEEVIITLSPQVLLKIDSFITERMHTWHRRITNQSPFTVDEVISKFRFCNIYRELDRQTIEIHSSLQNLRENFPLWLLNIAFQRFVCSPATISKIGLLSFDTTRNDTVYKKLNSLKRPRYGAAYVFPVSVIQKSNYPTREEFFCFYLPQVINEIAKFIALHNKASIVDVLPEILSIFDFNTKFHWTEILIDVAYQYPEYISLFKRFPIGPGSIPTMQSLNNDINPELIALSLERHQPSQFPYLSLDGKPILLSAENWEGIGCEFRKYTNLKNGNGRKRKYTIKASNGVTSL